MKVTSPFIRRLQLDTTHCLLTARSVQLVYEYFKLMDSRGTGGIDDVQFQAFLGGCTDLSKKQTMKVFDIFDLDRSGSCEFDEFYLLVCMLVAINTNQTKQFMYRHWRTCFELLDEDGSKAVSRPEFETLGFLFNFSRKAVRKIYDEFDVSGNSELDYSEFRLFVFAAIDMQQSLERKRQHEKARAANVLDKVLGQSIMSLLGFAPPGPKE